MLVYIQVVLIYMQLKFLHAGSVYLCASGVGLHGSDILLHSTGACVCAECLLSNVGAYFLAIGSHLPAKCFLTCQCCFSRNEAHDM